VGKQSPRSAHCNSAVESDIGSQMMSKVRQMRIHRFGGNEVLQADEVEPSQPDAGQVLIGVQAASVNPVDYKIRSGKYPAVKEDRLPYALGRDASGVIVRCGAQATRFKIGDEVFGMVGIHGGGYAEQAVLDEHALAPRPDVLTTCMRGLYRLRARPFGKACSGMGY
jgi:NADPH:quinone reductase-like Zn-dependent oxidoreductase